MEETPSQHHMLPDDCAMQRLSTDERAELTFLFGKNSVNNLLTSGWSPACHRATPAGAPQPQATTASAPHPRANFTGAGAPHHRATTAGAPRFYPAGAPQHRANTARAQPDPTPTPAVKQTYSVMPESTLIGNAVHRFSGLDTFRDARDFMSALRNAGLRNNADAKDFQIVETDCKYTVSFSVRLPPDKEYVLLEWVTSTLNAYNRDDNYGSPRSCSRREPKITQSVITTWVIQE